MLYLAMSVKYADPPVNLHDFPIIPTRANLHKDTHVYLDVEWDWTCIHGSIDKNFVLIRDCIKLHTRELSFSEGS